MTKTFHERAVAHAKALKANIPSGVVVSASPRSLQSRYAAETRACALRGALIVVASKEKADVTEDELVRWIEAQGVLPVFGNRDSFVVPE